MKNTNIYDGSGKRVGYTSETKSVVYAHDANGKTVGNYNKGSNITVDGNGKRFAHGNQLSSLIFGTKNKN